jgi:hypothetical protein
MLRPFVFASPPQLFALNMVTAETRSDTEAKPKSSVNDDPFIDVKQEAIFEPFSFVAIKVRTDEC